MTWRGRTFTLATSLLAVVLMTLGLLNYAAHRSPVVPRGGAVPEHLQQAIDELREDVTKTREEVFDLIRGFCEAYPELAHTEVCREVQAGSDDAAR